MATTTSKSFLFGQTNLLEMIAQGAPLAHILDELMRFMEMQAAGMRCSILLLSEDGKHLRHGAAPSLPASYTNAINGAPIGPRVGSCGTAAYMRQQVLVVDIEQDERWADFKHLALAAGLRACWSTPVFSKRGPVLGTFAMYYERPLKPTIPQLNLIPIATHLASIAIDADLAERERVRLGEELAAERQRLARLLAQLPPGATVTA